MIERALLQRLSIRAALYTLSRCISSTSSLAKDHAADRPLLSMILSTPRGVTPADSTRITFADEIVGQRIQPFWIEDEARKIAGTSFIVDQAFRGFAVRDGLLITGQQQFSGTAAARLVIDSLGR